MKLKKLLKRLNSAGKCTYVYPVYINGILQSEFIPGVNGSILTVEKSIEDYSEFYVGNWWPDKFWLSPNGISGRDVFVICVIIDERKPND